MPKSLSKTVRAFDVDFAHCTCKGTWHKTGIFVIAVRWKRKSCGKTRFQCIRCKRVWSMDGVDISDGNLVLDALNPQEQERRQAIHPRFDNVLAVNIRSSHAYRYEGEL